MRRRITAAALLLGALVSPARGVAQSPPRLPADASITLRPVRELERLAGSVARTLALRMEVEVTVGGPPPPDVPEAVPAGHVAMERGDGTIVLVLAGPEGQVYRSEVAARRPSGQAVVRSVALAIEALRDAALDGPPEGSIPTSTRRTFERRGQIVTWIYREREGGLFGPRRPVDPEAKPSFYLGGVAGLSTERVAAMIGPRIGLALCVHDACLAIEGDVPILPQETVGCDGRRIVYRPITLGLRLSMRPISVDDVVHFGFGLGLISRFGLASLVGVDVSRLSTDFGVRSALELSWRFAPPFEVGIEIGADVHVSPALFVRTPRPPPGVDCPTVELLLVEDLVTLWSALVVRVRP
ncbi:MAG TPA: hypothetical protein VIL20_19185 [Sandaracinaceae bacterium]